MPGIPSKDASFVRGTPRNYALTPELQGKRAGGKKDFGSYLEEVEIALYDPAKVFALNYISLQ